MKITTLKQFYELMIKTRDIRRPLVITCLEGNPIPPSSVKQLQEALKNLESIPREEGYYCVALDETKNIRLDLYLKHARHMVRILKAFGR